MNEKIQGKIEAYQEMKNHLGDCQTCNPQMLIWVNKQLKELNNE